MVTESDGRWIAWAVAISFPASRPPRRDAIFAAKQNSTPALAEILGTVYIPRNAAAELNDHCNVNVHTHSQNVNTHTFVQTPQAIIKWLICATAVPLSIASVCWRKKKRYWSAGEARRTERGQRYVVRGNSRLPARGPITSQGAPSSRTTNEKR